MSGHWAWPWETVVSKFLSWMSILWGGGVGTYRNATTTHSHLIQVTYRCQQTASRMVSLRTTMWQVFLAPSGEAGISAIGYLTSSSGLTCVQENGPWGFPTPYLVGMNGRNTPRFRIQAELKSRARSRDEVQGVAGWPVGAGWRLDSEWILCHIGCSLGGMPGLKEETLFHDISVWCDSAKVQTGPYVSLIRVTQPEGWWVIPELVWGAVGT